MRGRKLPWNAATSSSSILSSIAPPTRSPGLAGRFILPVKCAAGPSLFLLDPAKFFFGIMDSLTSLSLAVALLDLPDLVSLYGIKYFATRSKNGIPSISKSELTPAALLNASLSPNITALRRSVAELKRGVGFCCMLGKL